MLLFYEIKKLSKNKAISSIVLILLLACILLSFKTSLAIQQEENTAAEARNADFSGMMSRFITDAERSLESSASYADSYTFAYYTNCAAAYQSARDTVNLTGDNAEGWGALLDFDMLFYASIIAAVVIGAVSFYEDRRIGAKLVINATRSSGIKTAAVGTAAAVIVSLSSFLLLCGATVCAFALFSSLRGGGLPLQTAAAFRYSPYLDTLAGVFFRLTARRAFVVIAVTLLSAFVSAWINGYVPILIAAASCPAVEFILFAAKHYAVDVFSQNVNLFAYGTSYLFKKYYAVRFFGCVQPQIIIPLLLGPLCVLIILLIIWAFRRSRRTVAYGKPMLKTLISRLPSVSVRAKDHSVLFWELRKAVFRPIVLTALAVCITMGIISVCESAPKNRGSNANIYREMCETTSEMTLGEARVWLNEIMSKNNEYIPPEEDQEQYAEYVRTEIMQTQAKRLLKRINDLSSLQALGNVRLIYDEGYYAFFQNDMNIWYVISILLVCAGLFSRENEINTLTVIRTYRNGRRKTVFLKFLIAVCLASLLFIVFSVAEWIGFYDSGIMLHHDVLVASVMKNAASKMTIGQYMLLRYMIAYLAYTSFAAITAAISAISKRTLFAIGSAGALALIPFALRKTGDMLMLADISAFMSANTALQSFGTSAALACLLFVTGAILLIVPSYYAVTRTKKRG